MKKKKLLMLGLMGVSTLGTVALSSCDTTVNPLFVKVEEKVSITLNYGYDNLTETVELEKNGIYNTKTLTRDGYRFGGWYFDANYTQAFVSGSTVSSSLVLYAKWDAIEMISIKYVVDGADYATTTFEKGNYALKIPDPEKTGYTFVGWYLGNQPFDGNKATANATVEARFTINKYTVTFDLAGGTATGLATEAEYNTQITLPTPSKQGFTFKEFVDGDGNKYNAGATATIVKNTTFTAVYEALPEIKTVLITLNYKDGRESRVDEIVKNSNYQTSAPTREGYEFAGWYTDENYQNQFTSGTAVTTNITLYAKWNILKYDVIVNANGGKFDGNEDNFILNNVEYNTSLEALLANVTAAKRDGYLIKGFSLEENGDALTAEELASTKITRATTIYVLWVEEITVTYNYNGGTVDNETTKTEHVAKGSQVSNITPIKNGYEFKGWFDLEGNQVTEINSNVELFAKWQIIISENNITVTLKKVDLLTNKPIAEDYSVLINKGEKVDGTATLIFEDGYYLVAATLDNGNPAELDYVYNETTVITAKYIKKNYTYKDQIEAFSVNGSYVAKDDKTIELPNSLSDSNNIKFSIPANMKLTINVSYKSKSTITAADKNCTVQVLYNNEKQEGAVIDSDHTDPTSFEFTVYALNDGQNDIYIGRSGNTGMIIDSISIDLEALEPVSLKAHFGDETINKTAFKGVTLDTFLKEYEQKGYDVSYYSDENFTTEIDKQLFINSDVEVYIKKEAINYDVAFYDDDNHEYNKYQLHYGDAVTTPETNPTKEGYRFLGWCVYTDPEQKLVDFTDLKLFDSVAYKALWVEQVTVTFAYADGEEAGSQTVDINTSVNIPNAKVIEGYTFVGWFVGDQEFDPSSVSASVKAIAKYNINKYAITIALDGGTVEVAYPTELEYGSKLTLVEASKQGYEFKGYSDGENSYNAGDELTITGPLSLTAIYEELPNIEWVTITYNLNYEGATDTDKVEKGSEYVVHVPGRSGYRFDGWYTDDKLNTKYVDKTALDEDITLYAKWTELFKITYLDGDFSLAEIEVADGEKITELPTSPTKDDEEFEAWYKDASFTTLFDFENETITSATSIYAKWKFKVTFEGLEGTQFVKTNGTANIPNGIPTKAGYQFVSWIDADKEITADTEIKANWELVYVVYNLSAEEKALKGDTDFFVRNSNTVSNSIIKLESNKYLSFTIDEAKPVWISIEVYGTSGSSTKSTGTKLIKGEYKDESTGVVYTSELIAQSTEMVKVVNYSAVVNEKTTYNITRNVGTFAVSSVKVTVHYDVASVVAKDGDKEIETKLVIPGNKVTFDDPQKIGFDFKGWYKDSDLKEEFDLDSEVSGDLELYAKFEAQKFTLTIKGNGGNATQTTEDLVAEEIPYGSKVMELKDSSDFDPSREGYAVIGLSTTADGQPLDDDALDALTVDGDLELFIVWSKTATITFVDGNTTHAHTIILAVQQSIAEWPTKVVEMSAAKEGYEFVGWYIDDNTEFTLQTEISDNLTVRAKWIELFYVTYYAEGNKYDSQIVKDGQSATKPSTDPAKEHYDFKYWSLDITANDVVEYDFASTVNGNVDLYAYFELEKHNVVIDYAGGSLKEGATAIDSKVAYGTEITLPELTKTGFEFLYYTYNNEQLAVGAKITVLGDIEVTAVWEAKAEIKNVTYHYNYKQDEYGYANKPLDKVVEIAKGEKFSATEAPTRPEYNFEGWYTDEGLTIAYVNDSTVEADVDLYAKWTIKKFSWTIYGNGGVLNRKNDETMIISSNIAYGTAPKDIPFTDPFEPKLRGYEFKGYSYTADGELINMPEFMKAMIIEDVEIYVIWELAEYSITYNLDGGTNSVNNPTEFTIKTDTITFEDATKEGYRFDGWYCDLDDSNSKIETIGKGSVVENVIIYAKWTVNKYTIAFDANGGTGTMDSIEDVEYNAEQALTANSFTRAGYEFIGWATTADGDVAYADNASVTNLSIKDGVTVTLYAKWKVVSILYTFGATVTSTTDAVTKFDTIKDSTTNLVVGDVTIYATSDKKVTIDSSNKNLDGYSFGGRCKLPGKATQTYYLVEIDLSQYIGTAKITIYGMSSGSSTRSATVTPLANIGTTTNAYITLVNDDSGLKKASGIVECGKSYYLSSTNNGFNIYGIKIEFGEFSNVSFDLNGGTNSVEAQIVKKGDNAVEPASADNPTREHYTFAGWATRSGEEGNYVYTSYDFDSEINDDLILYATWTPVDYTVTFDANGGEFAPNTETSQKVTYNEFIVAQALPTKTGYTFAGWFDDATAGNEYDTTTGAIDASITLYAHWTANQYVIAFDGNEATSGTTASVNATYDEFATIPTNGFVKENKNFVNWNTKQDGTGESYNAGDNVKNLTAIASDTITLYAQWVDGFTVNFLVGSTAYATDLVADGGTTTKPANDPEKIGYTFDCWVDSNELEYDFTSTVSDNLELHAKFIANQYVIAFDGNGATSGTTASVNATYDTKTTLTANGFVKDGKTFVGWNTVADGSGAGYTDLAEVENLTSINNDTITLYAQWAIVVTFETNGGSDVTSVIGDGSKITKPIDPTRDGFAFAGWYSDEALITSFDFETNVNESKTLYAKWYDTYEVNIDKTEAINFKDLTKSDDDTTVTANFKTAETFTVKDTNNGNFVFSVAASSSNMLVESAKGLKIQKKDTSVSFTTQYTSTITLVLYQYSNDERGFVIKQGNVTYFELLAAASTHDGYSDKTDVRFNATTDIGTTYKRAKSQALTVVMTNCPAGTYSVGALDDYTVNITSISINETGKLEQVITGISADITNSAIPIISNVELSVKESEEKISLTSDQYEVLVDDVKYNNELLEPGKHTVTVKYGKYTVYSKEITVDDYTITSNRTFAFRTDTTTGNEIATDYNGTSGNEGGVLFVDATSGKLTPRNQQWAQFNNAKISFRVNAGAVVTVNGYNDLTFTMTGLTGDQTKTVTNFYNKRTLVEIESKSDNSYIDSISITYPTQIDADTTITFGTAGNYKDIEGLDYSSVSNDNGGNNSQLGYTDKELSFYVKPGANISISSFSGYTNYTITADGVTSATQTGTSYSVFVANCSKVTIISTNANNYFYSIAITYPTIIKSDTTINFGSEGNYKTVDGLVYSSVTRDSATNHCQMGTTGEVSFYVEEGATIKVYGYGGSIGTNNNDYTQYEVTANDATSTEQTGDYEVTVTKMGKVTIKSTNNNNYLIRITITY